MIPLFPPNDEMVSFLRAIKEKPEDDATRLIFADYLEENGHPERAAFLRLQCELTRREAAKEDVDRLRHEEETLIEHYALDWLGPWRNSVRKSNRHFTRGLIDLILHANALADSFRADRNTPRHFAWVERLTLLFVEQRNAVAIAPLLARLDQLVALNLEGGFLADVTEVGEILRPVWNSPALSNLRVLKLSSVVDSSTNLSAVIRSIHLQNLHTLRLHHIDFDEPTGYLLADPRSLPALKVLEVENCYADPDISDRLRERFGAGLIGEIRDPAEGIPF